MTVRISNWRGKLIHTVIMVAVLLGSWLLVRSTAEYQALNCTFVEREGEPVQQAFGEFACIINAVKGRPVAVQLFSARLLELVATVDGVFNDTLTEANTATITMNYPEMRAQYAERLSYLEATARGMRDAYVPELIDARRTGLAMPLIIDLKEMQRKDRDLYYLGYIR